MSTTDYSILPGVVIDSITVQLSFCLMNVLISDRNKLRYDV